MGGCEAGVLVGSEGFGGGGMGVGVSETDTDYDEGEDDSLGMEVSDERVRGEGGTYDYLGGSIESDILGEGS